MGKKNDAFLLSDGDRLRLSSQTILVFRIASQCNTLDFGIAQERDMRAFADRYVVTDRMVGSGAFGKVFMAIEQSTRTQLACKIVDFRRIGPKAKTKASFNTPKKAEEYSTKTELKKLDIWGDQKTREVDLETKLSAYFREFEMLCSFNHPNIIRVDKVFITNSSLYVFEDLATAGNLHNYLNANNNNLTEIESATLIWQILIAVQFLHEKNIVHRSLQPENILVTSCITGTQVLLTNFAHARKIAPLPKTHLMIEDILPYPIRVTGVGPMFSTDMYCIGVIAGLLLLGTASGNDAEHAFIAPRLTSEVTWKQIEQQDRWKYLSEDSKTFVTDLLASKDKECMSAATTLRHPWFSNFQLQINFKELYQRAVSNWRPRTSSTPLIEFVAGRSNTIRSLKCAEHVVDRETQLRETSRARNIPVEPPYKPFPRKMHEQGGLWPKRRRGRTMSEEAEEAIASDWAPFPIEMIALAVHSSATGPAGVSIPTKPAPEASTVRRPNPALPALLRSTSLSLELSLLTTAKSPVEPPKSYKKADDEINHNDTSVQDKGVPERRSSVDQDLPKAPYIRPLTTLGRQSKHHGGRNAGNVMATKAIEKQAPVALNVHSRSKLPSRPRLPSRSQSLGRSVPTLTVKRYTRSVYDHESDVDVDVDGLINKLIPSGDDHKSHDAVLETPTKSNQSSVWVHEEWLRLTAEEIDH